jgi:hypothetical protein
VAFLPPWVDVPGAGGHEGDGLRPIENLDGDALVVGDGVELSSPGLIGRRSRKSLRIPEIAGR